MCGFSSRNKADIKCCIYPDWGGFGCTLLSIGCMELYRLQAEFNCMKIIVNTRVVTLISFGRIRWSLKGPIGVGIASIQAETPLLAGLLGLLGQKNGLDVGEYTTLGNGDT